MKDTLKRVLLIGHGSMGQLYRRALSAQGVLCGVAVGTERSRDKWAAQLDVPVSCDLNALLETCTPDSIAILSPTDWHAPHARFGIEHDLPTMIIKPACVHPDTARQLHGEAQARKVPVVMAHEGCFSPGFLTIEAALRDNAIGDLREVRWVKEGQDQLSGGRAQDEIDAATDGRNLGYIYATAMHELYVANRIAHRTAPVDVDLRHVRASMARPELDVTLRYESDVLLRMRYNGDPSLPFRRGLQILGTKGTLLWLVQPGKTKLQIHTKSGKRDLPYYGSSGENPATPVIERFLSQAPLLREDSSAGPNQLEDLLDGARALESARLLTTAAAKFLDLRLDLEGIAGGVDRN